jgi:glycyl-tRNA synthetase (class II)
MHHIQHHYLCLCLCHWIVIDSPHDNSEFTLAEIEHFCNPADKRHPKFREVTDLVMNLLSRELQTGEDKPASMTAGAAVTKVCSAITTPILITCH